MWTSYLQWKFFTLRSTDFSNSLGRHSTPSKWHKGYVWMFDKGLACPGTDSKHNIDHTWRHTWSQEIIVHKSSDPIHANNLTDRVSTIMCIYTCIQSFTIYRIKIMLKWLGNIFLFLPKIFFIYDPFLMNQKYKSYCIRNCFKLLLK